MGESQYISTCQSCWETHFQATCSSASSPFFWPTYSRCFERLQPEHHLTVKLSPYTIMNWPWNSICYLLLKQYHLFDLDRASVDQKIQVNDQHCICKPSLFVILMKTRGVNSVDDLSMAKGKEACYQRWNRRRETQGILDTWPRNLSPRERENLIPGESGRAGVVQRMSRSPGTRTSQDEVSLQWDYDGELRWWLM